MSSYEILRREILQRFDLVVALAEQREAEVTVDRLVGARERLLAGRLTVVVCGEFNRGKSSLLNALLNAPNLLPVDAFFATRLVCTIGRAEREETWVTLHGAPGQPDERRRIRRDQIGEYADQSTVNPDAGRATLLEIGLPDERLAPGLLLVDTPGVGGVYFEHTLATKDFLPSADAVLFVASAQEPLSRHEVDFLDEAAHAVRGADNPDAMLFVLTKIDLVDDPEEFMEGMRARIGQVTGRAPAEVRILPVSSKAKISGLAREDRRLIESSGFPELEQALWTQLSRHRAKVLLGGALTEIDAAGRVLLQPLDSEETALRETSRKRIADLEQRSEQEADRLAELAAGAAPWRDGLRRDLEVLKSRLVERAEREFERIWTRAEDEYIDQREYQVKPERLAERLNGDLAMAVASVGEWGAKQAAQLQRDAAERIGLELGAGMLGQLPPPGLIDLGGFGQLQRPVRSVARREEAQYRTVRKEVVQERAAPSGAIRRIFGFFSGSRGEARYDAWLPPRIQIVEQVVEVRPERTWTEQVEEEIPARVLAERREALRDAIRDGRRDQRRHIDAALRDVVTDFGADITAELDSRIQRELERIGDTLPRLRAASRSTAEQTAARLAELAVDQQALRELRDGCADLVRQVLRPAGAGGPW